MVFRIYECRQSLHTGLCALDVARLLQAVDEEQLVGQRERTKYLNPMRDLFTDNELLQFQNDLAQMEDHRVVIWGPDLAEFLRRVPDVNATPDGKVLDLWMTEISTKSSECFTKEGFKEDFCANDWIRNDFVRDEKRGPRIEIPGEWNVARNGDKTSPHRFEFGRRRALVIVMERRQDRAADVRLRRRHVHTDRERPPDEFAWKIWGWQISKPEHTIDNMQRMPRDFAYLSGGQCAEAHFDYMTTTDMKTFHIKTATESPRYKGSRTSSASAPREHIVIYYDIILEVTDPQEDHRGTRYFGIPFIFSLNDSSQDDADQEGYVESFQ